MALRRASVAENKPPAQSPSISGRSWSWARSAPARCVVVVVVVVDSLDAIVIVIVVVTVLTLGSMMAVAVDACSWSFTDSDHQAYVAVWGVRGSKSRDPRSPSNQRTNQRCGCYRVGLVHNMFSVNYLSTDCVDFAYKSQPLSPEAIARIQFWVLACCLSNLARIHTSSPRVPPPSSSQDISGKERYGKFTRVYYEGAVAAVVVVDLSREQFESSLAGAAMWVTDITTKVMLAPEVPLPVILLGNKSMRRAAPPRLAAALMSACNTRTHSGAACASGYIERGGAGDRQGPIGCVCSQTRPVRLVDRLCQGRHQHCDAVPYAARQDHASLGGSAIHSVRVFPLRRCTYSLTHSLIHSVVAVLVSRQTRVIPIATSEAGASQ